MLVNHEPNIICDAESRIRLKHHGLRTTLEQPSTEITLSAKSETKRLWIENTRTISDQSDSTNEVAYRLSTCYFTAVLEVDKVYARATRLWPVKESEIEEHNDIALGV